MRTSPAWYELSPRRLELERTVLRSIPYFTPETEAPDEYGRLIVVGIVTYWREKSGKRENLRVRLKYPNDFPKRTQLVYDHDEKLEPGADGHLLADHQICLATPEREEFSLVSERLTEEVLGATLIWLDKRLIYDRTGRKKWPGMDERHGALGRIDAILERSGLGKNAGAVQWANELYESAVRNGRYCSVDVYSACPCKSGKKLKFCHGKQLHPLLKLLKAAQRSALSLEAKGS